MAEQIFTSFTKEELKSVIKESLSEILNNINNNIVKEEIFTIDEAAHFTKLAKQTIYQLTSKREIPFFKKCKKLFFKKSELEQWLFASRKLTKEELKTEAISKLNYSQRKKGQLSVKCKKDCNE
jgi:excisionase family DNA binding protein